MPAQNYKMLIVYDKYTKEIKQTSISDKTEPKCSQVCPYHDDSHIIDKITGHCTNCDRCFSLERDTSAFTEQFIYEVDDSEPNNKKLRRKKYNKIEWECDQELIALSPVKRYVMPSNTIANMKIIFKDEEGDRIQPKGRITLIIKRGIKSDKYFDLDGTISEVKFTWKSPEDNNDVGFKALVSSWHPRSYDTNKQMIMEIE